jgi:hypothetical protein
MFLAPLAEFFDRCNAARLFALCISNQLNHRSGNDSVLHRDRDTAVTWHRPGQLRAFEQPAKRGDRNFHFVGRQWGAYTAVFTLAAAADAAQGSTTLTVTSSSQIPTLENSPFTDGFEVTHTIQVPITIGP